MKTCTFTITKDSQDTIEEFVEWHHDHVGIDDIIIIEDLDSYPLDDILKKYDYVRYFKLKQFLTPNVIKLFNLLKDKVFGVYFIFDVCFKKQYDWCMFIDDDEFMDITKEELYPILERNTDNPYITMHWLNMKCDGYIYHPFKGQKYSLLNTYKTYCDLTNSPYQFCQKKQILNCNEKFNDILKFTNWNCFPHEVKENNEDGNIKLKHFKYKTFEEYYNLLAKRGECTKDGVKYHRKFEEWFMFNPEYKYLKSFLYQQFNIKSEFDVKHSNFNFN